MHLNGSTGGSTFSPAVSVDLSMASERVKSLSITKYKSKPDQKALLLLVLLLFAKENERR